MPHRKSGCRWGQGRPAGLSIAKSADAENAGATQHSPKQRPQSARSTACARSGASPEGPGSLLKGGLRPGQRRFAARLRPGRRLPGAPNWPRLRSGHYDRQQPWRRDRGQVMKSSVPVIDLTPWFGGDQEARAAVAAQVDAALQSVGFFLITGHGVPGQMRARVRAGGAGVLRAAARDQAALRRYRRRPGLAAARRRGQRLRRGHGDPAGPEGVIRGRRRPADRRPGRRRVLVPAQRLPGRGAGAGARRRRLPGADARARGRAARACARRRWAWKATSSPGTPGTPRTR